MTGYALSGLIVCDPLSVLRTGVHG
jgi:hypothetical protein